MAKTTDIAEALAQAHRGRMPKKSPLEHAIVAQAWVEFERGWGQRPDGFSLHLSDGARQRFIEQYNKGLPAEVPDEYSRPDGSPFVILVSEDDFAPVYDVKESDGRWTSALPEHRRMT